MDTDEWINRRAYIIFLNSTNHREAVEKLVEYESFLEKINIKDNYFMFYYRQAVIELREEKIYKILNGKG